MVSRVLRGACPADGSDPSRHRRAISRKFSVRNLSRAVKYGVAAPMSSFA